MVKKRLPPTSAYIEDCVYIHKNARGNKSRNENNRSRVSRKHRVSAVRAAHAMSFRAPDPKGKDAAQERRRQLEEGRRDERRRVRGGRPSAAARASPSTPGADL